MDGDLSHRDYYFVVNQRIPCFQHTFTAYQIIAHERRAGIGLLSGLQ
jgi:hypothetical protein